MKKKPNEESSMDGVKFLSSAWESGDVGRAEALLKARHEDNVYNT